MNATDTIEIQAREAAHFVASRFETRPGFGIVLGTGSGVLTSHIQTIVSIDYAEIPHFPVSTVIGHKGRLICGNLRDRTVIAMDGRFHLYEGHLVDRATLAIRVMALLGVKTLVVTNASGGVNPKFKSGEIMAINSHIDLMFRYSRAALDQLSIPRPYIRSDAYDPVLIRRAQHCARQYDFVLHTGVYGALLGPNYETRAEYRMLRRIGVDVAGMSTVPEVVVAAESGIKVLGLSVIANVARPDVLAPTSGQEVVDAAELAAPQIHRIVEDIICLAN
jgi:purine-nucleoside phosphorylase